MFQLLLTIFLQITTAQPFAPSTSVTFNCSRAFYQTKNEFLLMKNAPPYLLSHPYAQRAVQWFTKSLADESLVHIREVIRVDDEEFQLRNFEGRLYLEAEHRWRVHDVNSIQPDFILQMKGPEVLIPLFNFQIQGEYVSFVHTSTFGYFDQNLKDFNYLCEKQSDTGT